jgi:hypothetical protein
MRGLWWLPPLSPWGGFFSLFPELIKHIAGELEMTPSKLSRMLADNPNDPIHFPVDLLPELIEATGDKRPIYWLIERFLEDPDAKRRRALDHVAELMPRLELLLKTCSR